MALWSLSFPNQLMKKNHLVQKIHLKPPWHKCYYIRLVNLYQMTLFYNVIPHGGISGLSGDKLVASCLRKASLSSECVNDPISHLPGQSRLHHQSIPMMFKLYPAGAFRLIYLLKCAQLEQQMHTAVDISTTIDDRAMYKPFKYIAIGQCICL